LKVKTPGGPRLVVQPIGYPRLLGPASSSGDHDLQRILASARALAAERSRGASADAALVKLATTLTNDLARDLQHCFHVRSRRTLHARERAAIGVRPTSHAFPEARTAADADIRVDGAAGTFVLLGKNSRVHFFNREGRHVTSVRFQGEAIRARLDSGRWRPAEAAEIAQFRQRVAGGGPTLDR
jgi:predicted dehydrogenase